MPSASIFGISTLEELAASFPCRHGAVATAVVVNDRAAAVAVALVAMMTVVVGYL